MRFGVGYRTIGLFWVILVGIALAPMAAPSASERVIKFDAYRNGSKFGFSMVKIDGPAGAERVEVVTALRVGLGPITAFKYLLRTSTRWRDGKIVSLTSAINDDGDVYRVEARQSAAGLMVEGHDGKLTMATDILPTTYWRADMVTRRELLSTQHGRVLKVGFENLGQETVMSEGRDVAATHYAMRGDLDIDIWYDSKGDWVKLTFTVGDSNVEYKRVTPEPSDLAAFVPLDRVPGVSGAEVHAMIDP
jgi:hypothetical protein